MIKLSTNDKGTKTPLYILSQERKLGLLQGFILHLTMCRRAAIFLYEVKQITQESVISSQSCGVLTSFWIDLLSMLACMWPANARSAETTFKLLPLGLMIIFLNTPCMPPCTKGALLVWV